MNSGQLYKTCDQFEKIVVRLVRDWSQKPQDPKKVICNSFLVKV
jgi:hypothetical protein